eukprot:188912_1
MISFFVTQVTVPVSQRTMASDDATDTDTDFENCQLIKKERNNNVSYDYDNDTEKPQSSESICDNCPLFRCLVITLLLSNLLVLIAGFLWLYLSVDLSTFKNVPLGRIARPYTSGSIESVKRLYDFGIAASALPNNTIDIIYYHDPNMVDITDDESAILREIFDLFDFDGDDMWCYTEYATFIYYALEPHSNFDVIDMDHNGIISLKEIYLFLHAFDSTDIYECDETDLLLHQIFDYGGTSGSGSRASPLRGRNRASERGKRNRYDADHSLYNEYIAHLWLYQLDPEKIGVVLKDDYIGYIEHEEWEFHNHNNDEYVDFSEFASVFFDSIYYKSWKHSMGILAEDEDLINGIYDQIDDIDASDIASLTLHTTPHQFDDNISSYIHTHYSSAEHGATQSLLYNFPNIYYAKDLIDMTSRRRLTEDTPCYYYPSDPNQSRTCPERDNETWYCRLDEGHVWNGRCIYRPQCNEDGDCALIDEYVATCIELKRWQNRLYSHRWNANETILQCNYTKACYQDSDTDSSSSEASRDRSVMVDCGDDDDTVNNTNQTDEPVITTTARPGGGGVCFGEDGFVDMVRLDGNPYKKQLKDVTVGEYVFDGEQYVKVIAVEIGDGYMVMMKLWMYHMHDRNDNTSIVLTEDHLIYAKDNTLIRAGDLALGDILYNEYVVYNIEYNVPSKPSTPITMSGMVEVNGIKASCYIIGPAEANTFHKLLAPFRWTSTHVSQYYTAIVVETCIYDVIQIYELLIKRYDVFIVLDWIDFNPVFKGWIIMFGLLVIAIKYGLIFVASFVF